MKSSEYRILLVNPPRTRGLPVVREDRYEHRDLGAVYPPLSLLQAAGALRKAGFPVKLLDANGFDLDLGAVGRTAVEFSPHLCVTRLAFDSQEEDLKVLQTVRAAAPGCVTALRNKILSEVPSLMEAVLHRPEVDLFVTGELDSVLPPLARTLASLTGEAPRPPLSKWRPALKEIPGLAFHTPEGGTERTPPAPLTDVEAAPFPAYDLLPSLAPYRTGMFPNAFAMIQTSRGCPFGCSFCAYAEEKYRPASPRRVAEELQWLRDSFGVRHVLFFDDILALNTRRTAELAGELVHRDLGLEWVCCTRANLVDGPSLRLMREAGCRELAVGVESGSEKVLANIRKGVTKDQVRACAQSCREAGVAFYAMTILGLPGETEETWRETLDFIRELDPFYTQFCFSTPFPNTDMYPWYKERGLLLHEDWSEYSPLAPRPVARTEALSADDLVRLRRETYRRVLLSPGYLARRIRWTDPLWTLQGALEVGRRAVAALTGGYVR